MTFPDDNPIHCLEAAGDDQTVKEGETVKVKLLKVENGKLSLSRKVLLKNEEKSEDK